METTTWPFQPGLPPKDPGDLCVAAMWFQGEELVPDYIIFSYQSESQIVEMKKEKN